MNKKFLKKILKKYIYYILQFIGSVKFKGSSISNLVNNLSEGVHIKNVKLMELRKISKISD